MPWPPSHWQHRDCGVYADALREADPSLRLGAVAGPHSDPAKGHALHWFAHDDTHAYDSRGAHPLPYVPRVWDSAAFDWTPPEHNEAMGHRVVLDVNPQFGYCPDCRRNHNDDRPDPHMMSLARRHIREHRILDRGDDHLTEHFARVGWPAAPGPPERVMPFTGVRSKLPPGALTAHFAAARSYPAPGEPFSHMTHEQYDQYVRPHLEASELPPDDFINTNPPHHTQYHATPYSGKFPYDNWTHVGTRKAAEERATAVKPEHYGLPEGTRSSIYAVRLSGKVYPRVISDEMANDISGAGYDQAGRLLAEHGLPSGEGYHIFPYRNHTEDIGSVSYLAHHSAITRTAIITHEATAALGHPYLTNHAAVTPSHRFVRSSPTPGDPYRCTHPQCAEEWGPGQDQPTSRCPAPESTADIMQRKREQEMKLQQLQQASGESGDDQVGGGTEEDGEPKEEPGAKSSPAGHTAMISSLGNLIDAGAWNEPRREAERRA